MKRLLTLVGLALAAVAASAQTVKIDWALYAVDGSTPLSRYSSQANCDLGAKATNQPKAFRCDREITVTPACVAPKPANDVQAGTCPAGTYVAVPWSQTRSYTTAAYPQCWAPGTWSPASAPAGACVTIPAKPADETRTTACAAGQSGSWTQTRTYAWSGTAWVAGNWLPAAAPSGACVTIPPKPADETQTVQCVSPLVGAWTQTRSYVSAPAPTFWTAGPWAPTAAPAGACTAPPSGTWTRLATENQPFTVGTNQTVRFGVAGLYVQRVVSGTGQCTLDFFGSDPAQGQVKFCDVLDGTAPPDPNVGTALISWVAPTLNADGTPLTDLAGYRVYMGTAPGTYATNSGVLAPATSYSFTGLAPATYYFVVRAYDADGNESAPSIEVSKVIQ